ncbi:hypothetical protein EBZ38_08255 [bacterium]|nr:hypothetical protein [bacterium]NDD84247.1 hypothetical protein [bacterium]
MATQDLGADPAATIAAMDVRYARTTSRNVLAALKKMYPNVARFAEEAKARREELQALDNTQEPTAKQEAKYVSWTDLIAWRDANKDNLSATDYLLLCLYTMMPPRRLDFTPMKIVRRKPRKMEDGVNYLVLGKSSVTFIFHAYKTHAVYGDQTVKAPKQLERVVRSFLAAFPDSVYLLEDEHHHPWQEQRLSHTIQRIFKKHHGMDTSVNTIRHSYLTFIYKGMPSKQQLEAIAWTMGHSLSQSQAYRHLKLE